MALLTERITFTLDVLGRYTANTWQRSSTARIRRWIRTPDPLMSSSWEAARSGRQSPPGYSPTTTPTPGGSC
jgi:hypothetical protein